MIFEECKNIVNIIISKRNLDKINHNTIWHRHHILPKHFNGDDSENNMVKVTVEEHACIHQILFEKYGNKEDWLAWQGLSGFLGKEEIIKETIKIGASKAGKLGGKKSLDSGRLLEMSKKGIEIFKSKFQTYDDYREHFSNISKKQIGISKDKLKDWVWITNGIDNIKIKKDEKIPEGYKKGRYKSWKTISSKEPKEKIKCQYCDKIGGKPVMKRFHMENCKLKNP